MSNDKMREAFERLEEVAQMADSQCYMNQEDVADFILAVEAMSDALTQQPENKLHARVAELERQLALAESHLEAYRSTFGDSKQPESEPDGYMDSWEYRDYQTLGHGMLFTSPQHINNAIPFYIKKSEGA